MRITKILLKIVIIYFLLNIVSCKSFHPLKNYNYFDASTFYNDSIKIRVKYFGDMGFTPLNKTQKKHVKKSIKGLPEVNIKDVLVSAKTDMSPEYNTLLFYKDLKSHTSDSTEQISLVFKDSINGRALYRKTKGKKAGFICIEMVNDNKGFESILKDGRSITETISFDHKAIDELNYSKVFETYKYNKNYLLVIDKLKKAPVSQTKKNKWMQFQYLLTVNAFIANNDSYNSLIFDFENFRKLYLKPRLDTLLNHPNVLVNTSVIEKIATLAKKNRTVMLNENHWYPKHRKLAYRLLKPLKEAGYTHLALEALFKNQDSLINALGYPVFKSGYYTREPFFGHFIRQAKTLGFEIMGYESNDNNVNREYGQANNLKQVLDENSHHKIFVYAGIDHIVESETKRGKRMACFFKELTNIDPITINQVDVVSDTENELTLIPYDLMCDDPKFKKQVDYFVINNIKPLLNGIYDLESFQNISLKHDFFKNYKDKELLVSVYNDSEYSKLKSRSVPIISLLKQPNHHGEIQVTMPKGNFVFRVCSVENNCVNLRND